MDRVCWWHRRSVVHADPLHLSGMLDLGEGAGMSVVEFTVVGGMTLRRGDLVVEDDAFGGRQLRVVAAMLLLDRSDPIPTSRLVDAVWPTGPPDQYRPALRGLVSKVRRLLAEIGVGNDAISARPGLYAVDVPELRVDLEGAEAALQRSRSMLQAGDLAGAQDHGGAARAVLSRPVMPGVDAPWLDALRDRVDRQHLESLLQLGECRYRQGRTRPARAIAREALDLEPLREDVWRLAMRIEAGGGNASRAIELYGTLRQRLSQELGTDPSRETQDLHSSILVAVPDPEELLAQAASPQDHATHGRQGQQKGDLAGRVGMNPYVGLRAFEAADANRFFGREAATQEVVGKLDRHGAVAVVGPSGAGKSSLVRAGLLPALMRGAIPESDTWTVVVMTPGLQPLRSLAAALLAACPGAAGMDEVTLAAMMSGDPLGLHEFLARRMARIAPKTLLVVDQAEELFTLGDETVADAFLEAVFTAMSAARTPAPQLAAVMTLRADFYGQAAYNRPMAGLLSRAQFVLAPLGGDGLQLAITEPARRAGAHFEAGVLGRLVAGAGGEAGGLPLLQHVLWEMWERREHDELTLSALDALGGVSGALARHAEETWQALDDDEASIARRLLLRAVSVSDSHQGSAAVPVLKTELAGLAAPGDVESVVSKLVKARLLTASGSSPGGTGSGDDRAAVEVSHEALLREWPRLRRWIDDERETLLLARRVRDLSADWQAADRDPSHLLRGSRLAQVERHGRLLDVILTISELDFVTASISARRQTEEDEHRRRTVKQSRKLAVDALTTKTEDPERSMLLALESVRNSQESGLRPEAEAVGALHVALQASRLVRRFDAGARLVATGSDPGWIVVEESAESPNPVLIDLSTGSMTCLSGPQPPPGVVLNPGIWGLAATSDGRHLAASYDFSFGQPAAEPAQPSASSPRVAVFDMASGDICHEPEAPPGTYWSLDYNHSSSLLAGANSIDTVAVWDTNSYDLAATHTLGTYIAQVAFAPNDGTLVVLSSEPPGLIKLDPLTGRRLGFIDLPRWGTCLMAIQPQAELVALAYEHVRRVVIRDLNTGTVVHEWDATIPMCAAWSPDGATIAYSGAGGTITLRDVETGTQVCELAGSTSVSSLRFLADGRHVVNPTSAGGTNLWDISRAGRPSLGTIAADTGTIDNFWTGRDRHEIAISTHSPPAFELVDTHTGRPTASLQLEVPKTEPAVGIDQLEARANANLTAVAVIESDGRSTFRKLPDLNVIFEFEHLSRPLAVSADAGFVAVNARRPDMPDDLRGWRCQVWDTNATARVLDCDYGAHSAAFGKPPGRGGPLAAINRHMSDVFLHDLGNGELIGSLDPFALGLTNHFGIAFSPNGRLLAGGSKEGMVWVVDVMDTLAGTPMKDAVIFTMFSHTGPTIKPEITDAGVLATAGYDSHVRLWDIEDGSILSDFTIDLPPAQLPSLRFTHDQKALLYVEAGNLIRRFPLDVNELMNLADRSTTRSLTDDERRRHGLAEAPLVCV